MNSSTGNILYLIMCLNLTNTRVVNTSQQQEDQEEYITLNTSGQDFQFKLLAPLAFRVADLVAALMMVLLNFFLIILAWYLFTRAIIDDTEDDFEEIFYEQNIGVRLY